MTSSVHEVVSNSLWFAFDALDLHKTGVVSKTRLKELTRQIGLALGIDRAVEDCLTDYRSTDTLTYDQYLHFLEYEVFSDVCGCSTPYSEVERYHVALDALFWELGRHSLAPRYPAVFSPHDTYKSFRVFCLLADRVLIGGDLLQVSVRRSEVCEVCRHLVEGLGLDWDWTDWQMVSSSISTFTLPVFLTFLEGRYGKNTESSALSASVDNMYKLFVGQVFFQGRAYQRITRAGGWLRRDIEVVPWCIRASADTSEDLPDEGGATGIGGGSTKAAGHSPGKITAAVGRSLTLGRNAVGAMGGAVKTGVTDVVERSRTLSRPSPSPTSRSQRDVTPSKRGFSLGRWGSASGINNKKRDRDQRDSASLGGRESPIPYVETRRSHTLDRGSLRSAKSSSTLGSSPSPVKTPGGKPLSPRPMKESTKGIVGGVIGRVWKLEITPETTITSLKDTASGRPCKISIINTPTARPIVIAAHDHKSKARLLAALEEARQHCMDALPYQMRLSQGRRAEEEEALVRESEERVRRNSQADIIEQTLSELAIERVAREEAEMLAQNESVARAAEEERVLELTTLRQQLEALLHQETQAKQDEEIVRNLQSRLLKEEWQKREELERLQVEQQHLLVAEQRKRKAFEILQKDQEKKLREAETRLKILDNDRRRLDEELRAAREKIVMSGRGKQLVEAKMKVQQGRRPPIRTLSLRPSRQERASPARSSSFTTPPSRLLLPSPSSPPRSSPRSTHAASGGISNIMSLPKVQQSPATPGTSTSSTPATSPAGSAANKTILEYLENNNNSSCMNGSPGSTSPHNPSNSSSPSVIKSIPEQKLEEEVMEADVGWNITDEEITNGETFSNTECNSKTDNTDPSSQDVLNTETPPVQDAGLVTASSDDSTPAGQSVNDHAGGGLVVSTTNAQIETTNQTPTIGFEHHAEYNNDSVANDDENGTNENSNLNYNNENRYIEIKTYEETPSISSDSTTFTKTTTTTTTEEEEESISGNKMTNVVTTTVTEGTTDPNNDDLLLDRETLAKFGIKENLDSEYALVTKTTKTSSTAVVDSVGDPDTANDHLV
uniref:Mitogen-activated protein kinase kinase kinase kinase 4-like n=2 Tax=Hirondellea gigas TaxID=1518452 RepID=A0A6A7G0T8_9CRUS